MRADTPHIHAIDMNGYSGLSPLIAQSVNKLKPRVSTRAVARLACELAQQIGVALGAVPLIEALG